MTSKLDFYIEFFIFSYCSNITFYANAAQHEISVELIIIHTVHLYFQQCDSTFYEIMFTHLIKIGVLHLIQHTNGSINLREHKINHFENRSSIQYQLNVTAIYNLIFVPRCIIFHRFNFATSTLFNL